MLDHELPVHLQPLIDGVSTTLGNSEKHELSSLLNEYQDVFMAPDGKLKRTTVAEHYINTGDAKPIRVPCRRIPMFKRRIIQKEIEKMLEQDVIEPSTSYWNSPICLVTKKSGEWRFCVDLRALNSVTESDSFPLTRIHENLDRLGGSKFFSTLDMASGYWQLNLRKEDRPKTSFAINGIGTYMFKVMCFGLKNAPASFSRLMLKVLENLDYDKCLVYFDDIIVLGETFEQALDNLRLVFDRLRQANLQLKVSKCKLMQKEVVFLGHGVSEQGISCDPDKTSCIREWPQPRDKTEIKAFMGLASYYRKMVPHFAEIALPLTRLTRKNAIFKWGSEQENAFTQLKNCLTTAPILAFPLEESGSFVLDTDASGFAIGGIISQIQSGTERVIAYGSKTLNQAQQNYCTTKRELYSIVYFTQYFKHYLLGREFILRTDHAPLVWLCKKFKNPSGLWARWISILGQFTFIIQYRPGPRHGNADGVSRRPKRPCQYPDCEECSSQENREQFSQNDTEQNDTESNEQCSQNDTENNEQCSQNETENNEQCSQNDTENNEQCSQNDTEQNDTENKEQCSQNDTENNEQCSQSDTENNEQCSQNDTEQNDTENKEQCSQNDTESNEQCSQNDTENKEQCSQNDTESNEQYSQNDTENNEQCSQNDTENNEQCSQNDTENHEQFSQNDTENHEQFSKIDAENHEQFSQNVTENHEELSRNDSENHEQFSQTDNMNLVNTIGMGARDCKQLSSVSQNLVCPESKQSNSHLNMLGNDNENVDLGANWLNTWTPQQIKDMQSRDSSVREIIAFKLQSNEKPRYDQVKQLHRNIVTLWNQWEMLHLVNGILYRKITKKTGSFVSQLVAPAEMREFIFSQLHEQRYAAHLGRDRTLAAIKCRFYWPNMSDDVARWCSECQKCARVKPGPGKGRSEIQQIRAYRPMSVIALDILGPLNPTYNSNQYIIVVGDYFTKWKEAYPVPNHTAATVADKLVQVLFLRLGFPTQIHSDQGPEFESQLFAEMCKLLDIDKLGLAPITLKVMG